MRFIKNFFKWFAIIIVALIVLAYATGNSHLLKGIKNTYLKGRMGPSINESQIFANRVVKAGNYQPWLKASDYNKKQIPTECRKEIEDLKSVAFVVIQNDSLKYEEYWDGFNEDSHTNSFSMAKSILAVLCGVAIKDGKIKSVEEPIGNYLPEYQQGKNGNIKIKHLLTMSSGINFDEDYVNPFAYPSRGYYGNDLRKLTYTGYHAQNEPGKVFKYLSGDSQLLCFVIEAATGMKVSDYASEKLWKPIGAKNDAWWNLDHEDGEEKGFCCFNSNAPDFARIGDLYMHYGNWKGKQLIDSSYVAQSVSPSGTVEESGEPCVKYGYQWWMIPDYKGHKIFYMRGILGQYVICIPAKNIIVVRLGHKRPKTKSTDLYPKDMESYINAALEICK